MVGIWDQADDQIMLSNLNIQGFLVTDIERDWVRTLDALGELLGRFESPTR
jgi:hypothetical protein